MKLSAVLAALVLSIATLGAQAAAPPASVSG